MEGHNSGFVTTFCSPLNTQHTITLTHPLRLCCHSKIVDGDSQRRTAKSAHRKSLCSQLSDLCHCHRHNDAQHHPGPNSRPPGSDNLPWFISSLEKLHTGSKNRAVTRKNRTDKFQNRADYFIAQEWRFFSLRKWRKSDPCADVGSVCMLSGTVALPTPQAAPQGQKSDIWDHYCSICSAYRE